MPPGVARKNWKVDKDGYAGLPEGPGLGVEIDESDVREGERRPEAQVQVADADAAGRRGAGLLGSRRECR